MGSMTAFRDGKRHVAILTMQQDASGKFSGKYGFELELEVEPLPDFEEETNPEEDEFQGLAADAEIPQQGRDERASRRRLVVPNRDVYALDGKPKNPAHHAPAATIKSVLTFVVFDRSAWRMFWNIGIFGNGDNERKARATQYWNLISRDYITPVFINLGPFQDPCPQNARPCNALPDSVGYDFSPKLVFLNQNFNFPAGGLTPAQQHFTRGQLTNMLETEIDLTAEVQAFMANVPDTKIPVPLYILVTGQNIRGGVASDIDGFPNSLSGNVDHYGQTTWVTGASRIQDGNAYDCNILTGYLSGYRQVGLTDWDKGLWQHEIGHMMGAWHTHDAQSPLVQQSGYPDKCGLECRGASPNRRQWSNNYFDANHKGSIMSYCHMCPARDRSSTMSNYFQDLRFWDGNLASMRSAFQLWQPRVNNGGVWTKGYSKFQFKLDKGQMLGTGDTQAEVLLSEDSRCVLVVDGLTGQIQLFVRGNGKEIIWGVGDFQARSKLRFAATGDLQHVTHAGAVINTITSVAACGAVACELKLIATAPRTRATSCEMQMFAPGNAVPVWRSNNINVDNIQANACPHTDGTTANPVGCICKEAEWGKPPERPVGANVYCGHENIVFQFPTVFGVCADLTGMQAMNVDPREACRCGTKVCRLWENTDSYCWSAANDCRAKCPLGLNPGGNMNGCMCHLNPPTSGNAGDWCDRAGNNVYRACGDPPCVCGNALCQLGNKCEAGVCKPIEASVQSIALQTISKTKLPQRMYVLPLFTLFLFIFIWGVSRDQTTSLKDERAPLIIL